MNQKVVIETKLPDFIEEMKAKLKESEVKWGDFTTCKNQDLLFHFASEVKELSIELAKGPSNSENIASEAVDVANMAFILWWSAKCKGGY